MPSNVRDVRRSWSEGSRIATIEMYQRGINPEGTSPTLTHTAFGFEAEFYGMDQERAVHYLRDRSIDARDDGYHHNRVPHWRITEDGSVSGDGCELVSPVLHMRNRSHMADARLALNTLRDAGGEVNRTCGLHVHHNLRGKNVADVAETVAHWALFQPILNRILPRSRHEAEYATGMHNARRWYNSVRNRSVDLGADARPALTSQDWGRYHAINLEAIGQHGTLEYRQHSGTLSPDKLEHWVLLTRAFHDVRKIGTWETVRNIFGSDRSVQAEMTVGDMCDYLRLPKRTKAFYEARELQLVRYGDDEGADQGGNEEGDHYDGDENDDGAIWCSEHQEWHYEDE